MRKEIKRYFASMALTAAMTAALSFPAFAARIAFSDPSGNVGDEITVNMKITGSDGETINSSDVMLSYDSSSLEFVSGTGATGGAGSLRVVGNADTTSATELSFALKFKALKAGNSQITVSTQEVYDKDGQTVNIDREGSSAVTIAGAAGASSEAGLSDLQISPGSLSPSFSADVTEYTATVGSDTDKITVSAASADAQASVSVTGNENLQLGDNEVVCTVTAADGQTAKTYTIHVTKVEGAVSDDQTQTEGVQLKTPERLITVLPASEGLDIPEGFTSCEVSIDGHDVQGWIWGEDQNPSYCVFYAMNENGEKDFYRYDLTEKTLQRYFRDPASGTSDGQGATADEYNSLLKDYNMRFWIIIGLIALSVILLIVIIVLVATRGPKDDFYEHRDDGDDYPHKAAKAKKEKASRRVSREEKYLSDLEDEEDEYQDEDDLAVDGYETKAERPVSREPEVRQEHQQPVQSRGRQQNVSQPTQSRGRNTSQPAPQRPYGAETAGRSQVRQSAVPNARTERPVSTPQASMGDTRYMEPVKRTQKPAPAPAAKPESQDDDLEFVDLDL